MYVITIVFENGTYLQTQGINKSSVEAVRVVMNDEFYFRHELEIVSITSVKIK